VRNPVHVAHFTICKFPEGMSSARMKAEFEKYATESYWAVSAGMIGECGHKHTTEEEAEECIAPMRKKYHETRWPKKRVSK
jgi:hypothetical protein